MILHAPVTLWSSSETWTPIFSSERHGQEPACERSARSTDQQCDPSGPGGNISYVYDKIHLVPFGEYVPLRRIFFFLDKLVAGIGDYESGNRAIKAHTRIGSFGTFICYEIIFPGLVRKCFSKDGDLW